MLGWGEAAMMAGAREVEISPSIVGAFPRNEAALVELGAKAVNPADVSSNIAKRVHEIMLGDADKDPAIEPNASQAKLFLLNQVYLCEKLTLVNEMYFALTLDPKAGDPVPIDVFTGSANEDALKVIDGGLALKAAAVDQMKKLYNLSSQSDYSLLKADNSLV
ncbi:succinate--CoA ligase [ADP-forming] subunit beta, mitochondrial-like [Silene latifolia]|uniref:succinate--CoA ligase [ADP-forming] subunit beta, mitochondrial-like n=1 Tax=Silene latifolia TaxID=37657 RepID=UPI003D789AEF